MATPIEADSTLAIRAMLTEDIRLSYAAIGARFGVSRQRVGQVAKRMMQEGRSLGMTEKTEATVCIHNLLSPSQSARVTAAGTTDGYRGWKNSKQRSEHAAYWNMIRRCYDPDHPLWRFYGGRGITVTPEWRGEHGFESFVRNVGRKPGQQYFFALTPGSNVYSTATVKWTVNRPHRQPKLNADGLEL